MFPIRDHNPSSRTPWATYLLIAANAAIFAATAAETAAAEQFYHHWALIPALSKPATFVTSQFLHAGLMHLLGNMWFLWLFGDNLEEEMGTLPYLGFYLASGVAAGLAQVAAAPSSTIPMIGASGAVAGVMGGYLLLFPRARIDILLILLIFFRIVPIPAWTVLVLWLGLQIASGVAAPADMGGVAYWAHAGGFLAGLAGTVPLWLRRGGPGFWRRTEGHPPHPAARYATRRSPVPKAGRRR